MAQTEQPQNPVGGTKGTMSDKDAWNLVLLCHLGGLLGFLPPLIIWLLKKDDSPLIDEQGKEATNFQLTMLICFIASWILFIVFIGIILLPIVGIFDLVMIILAAVKASKGEKYHYPLAIRFLK